MIKTQKDQNDHKDHVRVKGIIIIKGVGPSWFGKSSSPLFGGNCPQVNLSLCLCLCLLLCVCDHGDDHNGLVTVVNLMIVMGQLHSCGCFDH